MDSASIEKNAAIKCRLWGTFCVSIIMILVGMVSRYEMNQAAPGAVAVMWFFITWHSARGNVSSVKNVAKIAVIIQSIGYVIFLAIALNENSNPFSFLGLTSEEAAISYGLPLLIWVVVFYNAKAKLKTLIEEYDIDQRAKNPSVRQKPPLSALNSNTASSTLKNNTEKVEPTAQNIMKSEATTIKKREENIPKDLIDDYPNAKTVIEYEASAAECWKKLNDKEESLSIKFLKSLDEKPQQDVAKLYKKTLKEYEAELNPYKDEETNEAYQKAREISDEAKLEFERVYKLLGSKITPDELLTKIRDKFAPATKLYLYDGWEDELMKSEWTGDISSMLTALNKIGYSVNAENKSIVRPSIGGSPPIEMGYSDANDLMTKVAFERKMLVFNNLIDLG